MLVEMGGDALKPVDVARALNHSSPTPPVSLLFSSFIRYTFRIEKLFIRKVYGRKEGNSKGAGGDGGQCS